VKDDDGDVQLGDGDVGAYGGACCWSVRLHMFTRYAVSAHTIFCEFTQDMLQR
jgi:hypothetical protein